MLLALHFPQKVQRISPCKLPDLGTFCLGKRKKKKSQSIKLQDFSWIFVFIKRCGRDSNPRPQA